jgi:arsenate reductase
MTAHWGVPDPAAVEGSASVREKAFSDAFRTLEARIKLFACLPVAKLEGMTLRHRLAEIGKAGANSPG